MADILNTYTVFENNQVLSSTQLNKLVNYLDQQNRLTRARLIGMGVVCGLELEYNSLANTITISKGTGITSEGYLISLGECITEKYRDYTLPAGTIYEPFVNPTNNEMDISLWELLTDEAEDTAGVTYLNSPAGFLTDKVVLLFLESYDKDLKSCLGKSCDELGKERILTIRKLLISQTDLATVLARTNTGKLDAIFPEKYNLPVINLPRVLFNPDQAHSTDYDAFSTNYADAISSVFTDMFTALSQTYDIYRILFLESYDEQNPFETAPISDLQTELLNFIENSASPGNPYMGIQYVYDLFQDLILGYNEFRKTSFELLSECCSDMDRFPKHLMLGEAIPPELSLCEQSEYRHIFVHPPIYNLQKDLLKRTIALHNKLVLMLESFDLERINGIVGEEGDYEVKITPSFEKTTPLTVRSIPWYYNTNIESSYSNLGSLQEYWNYDINKKCPESSDGLILNYDAQLNNQSSIQDKLATPLFYDIQEYSFLRIEGHINKNYEDVVNRLNDLKAQFNLAFKTVVLQLNTDVSTLEPDYSCGFEDIQEEYTILRTNFCALGADSKELFEFINANSDNIFDDEEDPAQIERYLQRMKEIVELFDELCQGLVPCVYEFDFDQFQENYKQLLTSIIDLFLVEMELMDEINIQLGEEEEMIPVINGFAQRIIPIVFKFIDSFFYNKLLRVYYSFKRREYYRTKETAIFSNYLRNNPGLEHQAGVKKGGTFVLVYNNSEDNTVIADFNLPYLCCNEDNCIPICEDDDEYTFEISPLARPDYAITTVGMSVEIDVMRNDYNLFGGSFIIETDDNSENGGTISQSTETGPLVYSPPAEFTGYDRFNYRLINTVNGEQDKAKVTVLVKLPEAESGCYSTSILECWGEEAVNHAIEVRKLEPQGSESIYELLLSSLRETGGFTTQEISYNVLESEARRRSLLKCIGISIPSDATYEDLANLILQYQSDNCGGGQTTDTTACYSLPILNCWGLENVRNILDYRKITIGDNPSQQLLTDLRNTGGFTDSEIKMMIDNKVLRALLECIGIIVNADATNDEMSDMLRNYQLERCGSSNS